MLIPGTEELKAPMETTPSEEHKVLNEEQCANIEEQKTHTGNIDQVLVNGQEEKAEEKREVGVGVRVALLSCEQDMEPASGQTDEVDSREFDAVQEVNRPSEQEDNRINRKWMSVIPANILTKQQLLLT